MKSKDSIYVSYVLFLYVIFFFFITSGPKKSFLGVWIIDFIYNVDWCKFSQYLFQVIYSTW